MTITAFDRCVASHESTLQNDDTGNGFYGYYQFVPSTWVEAERIAGVWYGDNPTEASFYEQTLVFNAYEPTDPGAWPESVPACGG